MPSSRPFELVRAHVDAERLPHAVFGLASSAGIIAVDGFGASTDDRYPLFSVTKPLVGLSVARAIERGSLSPLTPLTDAVPEFGRDRDDIVRLWHLASHTSGISEPALDTTIPLRTELVTRGRDFIAGTASRYSTVAFEGLAALTEHATGIPWDRDIASWAAPLGADGLDLDLDSALPVVDAEAAGLRMDRFAALRSPGAGLAGRATDLLQIAASILRTHAGHGGGIVSPATLAMMRRPLTGDIPRLAPYLAEAGQDWGLTWNLRTRARGLIDRDTFGHAGWAGTELWIHPTADIAWVLLTAAASRDGVDRDLIDNAVIGAL